MDHLPIRLFYFKNYSARMAPGTSLVQEFSILHGVIHLVESCCPVQRLVFLFRQFTEFCVLLESDSIFAVFVFKNFVQIR